MINFDSTFWRCTVKSPIKTVTNPQPTTKSQCWHVHVIPVDTLPSPLILCLSFPPSALLSHFSLPSLGSALCHRRDDRWGSTSSREWASEGENRGRLHSLFTSLGIGILMLKAIGLPFIKLTGDVEKERRGCSGKMGSEGGRDSGRGERSSLLNGP